ncbi:MAG: neutral zinc metallopeptidase [Micrococcales bacterium]|nr:neutral zinc metallopeptidase [Micrococcales bacterium]MCL2667958.1 neutral zinc metallopeptidase [Micrococcales bacterium]
MTFSSGGQFEGGRVRTGSGRGVAAKAAGGGIGGLVLVALVVLLQGGGAGDVIRAVGGNQPAEPAGYVGECTAEQANAARDCRLSATSQALDAYWEPLINSRKGATFAAPTVWSFSGSVSTACGNATSAVGPFYCPADNTIYIDLSFYDQLSTFGIDDGPLAEEYITAHEYGHHIQNILGTMSKAGRDKGSTSGSVRLELQADCYAGMWAGHAATTVHPGTGVPFLDPITDEQLANAQAAAKGVGDDAIAASAGMSINPDTWTHGSSKQRVHWFMVGYQKGSLAACDTFAVANP